MLRWNAQHSSLRSSCEIAFQAEIDVGTAPSGTRARGSGTTPSAIPASGRYRVEGVDGVDAGGGTAFTELLVEGLAGANAVVDVAPDVVDVVSGTVVSRSRWHVDDV